MNRRTICAALASIVLAGCAAPPPAAPEKRYKVGESVLKGGVLIEIVAAQRTSSYRNWLGKSETSNGQYMILAVRITNQSSAPIPYDLRPQFSLSDSSGAVYSADEQRTHQENLMDNRLRLGQVLNPNVPTNQLVIFEVPPGRNYSAKVIVPESARYTAGGQVVTRGPFYWVDL